MAHELATTDGRTAMMFIGDKPWHGLGSRLDTPATAAEAITAAGLDYEVTLTPMATMDGLTVPQRRAVVRYDSQRVLGVVSDRYVPVQNRQSFAFMDSLVADGSLRYHTAGALGQGERIWLLAKLPSSIRVKDSDDISEKFLLLSNSHDGSSALRVYFTAVRVVCANTLALADRQSKGEGIAIRHSGDLASKVGEARAVLGLAQKHFDDLEGRINVLANHYPTPTQLKQYFEALYPDPDEEKNNRRAANIREELHRLFETGIGLDMPAIKGTGWAAVNALTEWVDHHRPSRGPNEGERASRRLESAWFGSGAKLKEKAFHLALEMAASN